MSQQVQAQKNIFVWSDLVYDTAIAKSINSPDAINSNAADIVIQKENARAILGLMVGYCLTAGTDAEGVPDLILEINSKALGIQSQEVIIGNGSNDYDALTPQTPMKTVFVPFKAPTGKKLFNADLSFKASPSETNTGGLDIVVACVYSNAVPDMAFQAELLAQLHGGFNGGVADSDAAKAMASGGAAVPLTALTIPTGGNVLRGLFANIRPNALVVDKPISGFMEFIASGITDFSPQLWVLSVFWNPSLGTVIDYGPQSGNARYYPTRFPLSGSRTIVSVSSTVVVGQTTAQNTSQGLLYDE